MQNLEWGRGAGGGGQIRCIMGDLHVAYGVINVRSQHLVRYTAAHATLLPTLALHEDTKNGCVTDCRTLGRAGLKR